MIINTADPINTVLLLIAILLLIYLGKETKKSRIPQIVLIVCLGLIIMHTVQFISYAGIVTESISKILSLSIAVDFGFIMISALGYLWVDDIEAKVNHSKVISNSLDWFWKKI